jgi:hypothetical protein
MAITLLSNIDFPLLRFTPLPALGAKWQVWFMDTETSPDPRDKQPATPPPPPSDKEVGGRGGPDPVRYGDWEKGGIAVDF